MSGWIPKISGFPGCPCAAWRPRFCGNTLFLISDPPGPDAGAACPTRSCSGRTAWPPRYRPPGGGGAASTSPQQTSHRMGASNPTILDTFDFPEMTPNCLERVESTVVPQALHLLNDGTVRGLADSLAERVRREAGSDPSRGIEQAYWNVLNRPPTSQEQSVSRQALEKLEKSVENAGGREVADQALAKFCHTLLNSAGFLYID